MHRSDQIVGSSIGDNGADLFIFTYVTDTSPMVKTLNQHQIITSINHHVLNGHITNTKKKKNCILEHKTTNLTNHSVQHLVLWETRAKIYNHAMAGMHTCPGDIGCVSAFKKQNKR